MKADRVVVLEKGRIVEQGTYQELIQQRGQLWRYHQMQHEVVGPYDMRRNCTLLALHLSLLIIERLKYATYYLSATQGDTLRP